MGGSGWPELDVALAAAHDAGRLLLGHFGRGVTREYKAAKDPVTVADREAERVVRAHIADAFGDLVVGEEGAPLAETDVRGRRRWYVDPLDGTINFSKGQPRWAVAIGFCDADDRMAAGVIHVPAAGETFAAVLGAGATRDGSPVTVTDVEASEALALIDQRTAADPAIVRAVLSIRITGSTACDLADLACGRADAYLGVRQGRWDLAAGLLLAAEAGATVSDPQGRPIAGPADAAFAAAPRVHTALLPALRG